MKIIKGSAVIYKGVGNNSMYAVGKVVDTFKSQNKESWIKVYYSKLKLYACYPKKDFVNVKSDLGKKLFTLLKGLK
jgi:hypothetical protein